MTHTINASISFEIELELSATFVPGYAGIAQSMNYPGEPGEDEGVEDIAIDGLGIVSAAPAPKRWQTKTLLDGVDTTSPDIQRLFANILEQVQAEAEEALIEGVSE